MAKQWYVVRAYSGYEKQVKRMLEEQIDLAEMKDSFDNILVPSEEVIEIRDGKKRTSERCFFPGYVLVEMDMSEETWHLVRHSPKVMGFIGGNSYPPTPIQKKEVDEILSRVIEGEENPRPKIAYQLNEVVRVIDGPFNEFEAVVESVDYEKSSLDVSVVIFGRSTRVVLEFDQVQKI
jgi:transcriptional antiterminator NusG